MSINFLEINNASFVASKKNKVLDFNLSIKNEGATFGSFKAIIGCPAVSSNLNMSNSRAIIDGKSKLASQINNEITSRMTDLLEDLGNYDEQVKQASERVIKSVSAETQIAGYQEIKSEFQNIGDKFQTYVLLEYPIDQANQLLFKQIKQDSILSNQEAIDSALEELEAEINKKN